MTDHNTMPSAAQLERLAILMEECAEVQQVIGKILRHGWRNTDANGEAHCNRIALEHELGDLWWIIGLLVDTGDITAESVLRFAAAKPEKAAPFFHHEHAEVEA